jgi:crossover junction endodeoxyribonuclease RusA
MDLKAVPKERPRVGKSGHVYTPKRTRVFEAEVKKLAKTQVTAPMVGGLVMTVSIFEAFPKGFTQFHIRLAEASLLLPTRGDLDNKVKAVSDALNGIAFLDDAQIGTLHAYKRYRPTDLIEVTLTQISLSPVQLEHALYSMKVANGGSNKPTKRST